MHGEAMNNERIMSAAEMTKCLDDLAEGLLKNHPEGSELVLIGIQRRGVDLAGRLKDYLDERRPDKARLGKLDINFYRDDWSTIAVQPEIGMTDIRFDITDKTVILVDDVIFTGRTVRCALEGILDFGRPKKVELLVLVDRGCRELPIQPDYVGLILDAPLNKRVDVYTKERDGIDEVRVTQSAS